MSKNLRHLRFTKHQRISYKLTMERIGEHDIRNINALIRGLFIKGNNFTNAAIFDGFAITAISDMTINISSPMSVVQFIDDDDVTFAIDNKNEYNLVLEPGEAYDRVDIVEANITKVNCFMDNIDVIDSEIKSIYTTNGERDYEIIVDFRIKKGGTDNLPQTTTPGTSAMLTGVVQHGNTINLSTNYLLTVSIKESEFATIDLRGAIPEQTTREEIISTFNNIGLSASFNVDGYLSISYDGITGTNSFFAIRDSITNDGMIHLFGGSFLANFYNEYRGTNPWFKVAEITVPSGIAQITHSNIIDVYNAEKWTLEHDTIITRKPIFNLLNYSNNTTIDSQMNFNNLLERIGPNEYKIKDSIKSVHIKNNGKGYLCYGQKSFLTNSDQWGCIKTNNCINFQMEPGAFLDCSNNIFFIEANTNHGQLHNIWIKGNSSIEGPIDKSFQLNAQYVTFHNCIVSDRYSNVNTTGFQESETNEHNITTVYNNCKTINLLGTAVRSGFSYNINLNNCYDNGKPLTLKNENWTFPLPIHLKHKLEGNKVKIAYLGNNEIAAHGYLCDLQVVKYDGFEWKTIGTPLEIENLTDFKGIGDRKVIFITQSKKIIIYLFNGFDWNQVGNEYTIEEFNNNSRIAQLSSSLFAVCYGTSESHFFQVVAFDGTDWSTIGQAQSISGEILTAINNTDFIVFQGDNNDGHLQVYRFTGDTFIPIGSKYDFPGVYNGIDAVVLKNFDILVTDAGHNDIRLLRFNGKSWQELMTGFKPGAIANYPSIITLNSNEFAYIETFRDELGIFRLNNC